MGISMRRVRGNFALIAFALIAAQATPLLAQSAREVLPAARIMGTQGAG